MVLEVLPIQIRNCQDIKHVFIEDMEVKISAYADDSYFFLRDTISVDHLLRLYTQFEIYFYPKINLSLMIGASR